METERYFLTSRSGKHLLYIEISPVIFDLDECYLLTWDVSFPLRSNYPHQDKIIDILAKSIEKNYTRDERLPLINQAWELIKKLPEIRYYYLPEHLLVHGQFSTYLKSIYEDYERRMEKDPSAFIHLSEPYSNSSHLMEYQIISTEIQSKFLRFLGEEILFEISRECFQEELITFDLKQAFVQCLYGDNRYYSLSYDFPGALGWIDMLFIIRRYHIPLFLFRKSPLSNLFTKV